MRLTSPYNRSLLKHMLSLIALLGLVASSYIRQYLLAVVIVLELLLLGAVISNVNTLLALDESSAQVLVVIVITIAGSETSCALALIVRHYSQLGNIQLHN